MLAIHDVGDLGIVVERLAESGCVGKGEAVGNAVMDRCKRGLALHRFALRCKEERIHAMNHKCSTFSGYTTRNTVFSSSVR